MKKIVYIVKTKLHYYPPCISQIRMLKDLGIEVEVLYGSSEYSAIKILKEEKIVCTKVGNLNENEKFKFQKVINWLKFRLSLSKKMKCYDKNETFFWFGTAETVIPMLGNLFKYKYIVSLLELMDKQHLKLFLLKPIVKKALAITVCEEGRAYLQKDWWNLKKLPFVFPNKTYKHERNKNITPSCDITKKYVKKIGNEKFIMYQGIIQNTEELIEIARALNKTIKKFKLVLMGIDKYNSVKKIKEIYDNILFIPYIPSPLHLEITSRAYIGITYYRPDDLNRVFCAPNKIYEYSGFGIPMLCNDVLGLKNTVGKSGAAVCIDLKEDNIVNAIDRIDKEYKEFSLKSTQFFESADNEATMKNLLDYIGFWSK